MNPSVVNRAWLETAQSIDSIATPSAEEFHRRFVRPALPVVIKGAALTLGAIERWTSGYLKAAAGHRRVPIEFSPDKEFAVPERIGKDQTHSTFGRFVDYLLYGDAASQTTYYLAQIDALRYLPELVGDVVRPPFAPLAKIMRPPYLWMGIGRNASKLHYDSYDNLYAMINGRKHITLFPPADRRNLYPYNDHPKYRHFSRLNLRLPDLDRFPRLLNARPFECVLCRGDILYIPEGWWHYLRSHGLNVAVNWWWIEGHA
ncbi:MULTISPECIES: cupin-like domain-containing protein [Bradyrhizobium]|nr:MULTISPECIES: cupin-like domain-containing protein [Bradyrhizobium]